MYPELLSPEANPVSAQWSHTEMGLTHHVAELFSVCRCANMEATGKRPLGAFQILESRYGGNIRARLRLTLELIQQIATFIH